MEVATHKYRFRVLNGSNARLFQLALSNAGHSAKVKTSTSGWLDQELHHEYRVEKLRSGVNSDEVIAQHSSSSSTGSTRTHFLAGTGSLHQVSGLN
jgi:FtsP/CotA-like multicopper oxidase with cupredoxin domain